jgi:hypothetical protein
MCDLASIFAITDMSLEKKARIDNKKVDNWSQLPTRLLAMVLGYLEWYEDAADCFCVCKSWSAVPDHLQERLQKAMHSTIGFTLAWDGRATPGVSLHVFSVLFPEWEEDTPGEGMSSGPCGRGPFYIGPSLDEYRNPGKSVWKFRRGELLERPSHRFSIFVEEAPTNSVWKGWSHRCKVPAFVRLALMTQMPEKRWRLDEVALVAQRKCSDVTQGALAIVDVSSGLDPSTGKITEECLRLAISI